MKKKRPRSSSFLLCHCRCSRLLEVPRSVVGARLAAEHALKGRPELGAEDGVDDGVESGVEVPEPEEEGDESVIELGVFEDGHDNG